VQCEPYIFTAQHAGWLGTQHNVYVGQLTTDMSPLLPWQRVTVFGVN
jgi:hypothetical protein